MGLELLCVGASAVMVGVLAALVVCGARLYLNLLCSEHEITELKRDLAQAEQALQSAQLSNRERLHDARSVLAGLAGGISVLTRNGSPERRDLRRMLVAELDRLQSLLDPNEPEPITDFQLDQALEPVLLAHRLDNEDIRCELDPVVVRGRPHATAAVLDNILRNAHTHAPGAAVNIEMSTDGQSVVVVRVGDDGPGIPRAECATVLRAGVRGSTARGAGSGLGLHSAATAMAKQDGFLRIDRRTDGGTMVTFSLPLSAAVLPRLNARRSLAALTEAS
jgi:signal transduction histidine kinase